MRTAHGQERAVDIEIRLAGFEVFAPTLFLAAEKARRYTNGSVRPARPDRVVPMFRRYVFVRFDVFDLSWRRILRLPDGGVDFIFSTGEVPTSIPDQAIAWIREQCELNDCSYPPTAKLAKFELGARARVIDGPLARDDVTGICQWSDGRRTRLLMRILGRDVEVTVDQASIEAV